MNTTFLLRLLSVAALLFVPIATTASPGAHGPNGEHLGGPGSTVAAGTAPRFETRSEAFEMVGRLSGGELSMFINRYETNEPVNNAKVEIELGNLKATAPFHADQGDYAVADEALLKALAQPGEHAMLVTLVAGNESDLLEGTLVVPDAAMGDHGHQHGHGVNRLAVAVGVVVLLATAAIAWRLRSRRRAQHLSTPGAAQ